MIDRTHATASMRFQRSSTLRKLRTAAFAASLAAFPAAAHAQPANAHPPGADPAQHDPSAPAAGEDRADPAAMPQRPMRDGMHMKNCCCPCCETMKQHCSGKAR
jgi:hypothetical protein